jgi:hypothetical protein
MAGNLEVRKVTGRARTPAWPSSGVFRSGAAFTRLTDAFFEKVENDALAVVLFTTGYNFVRIQKALRVTPRAASDVTDKLRDARDIVKVLEDWEAAR